MTAGLKSLVTGGLDPRFAGGTLTIDLGALADNYRALAKVSAPARAAAVVKADAYGLGVDRVVPALVAAGCGDFFVALPHEGIAVRALAPEARIFVLGGMWGHGVEPAFAEHRLVPVLNTSREAALWEGFCGSTGTRHPCAIHVDTGMNRLGLAFDEALSLAEENMLTRSLDIVLVMSHFACADEPDHPLNARQAEGFAKIRAAFEGVEASIANSAGILLGRQHHLDMVRPGIAVYGGAPRRVTRNPMRAVVTAQARIVQLREARAGETVSYGATVSLERDSVIAVTALGYADGLHRALSGAGVPMRAPGAEGGHGHLHGRRVPILGRITMDATMFDVTDLGVGGARTGDMIELFGRHVPIDEAADAAGTVSYELLTGLGRRYHRIYVGGGEE